MSELLRQLKKERDELDHRIRLEELVSKLSEEQDDIMLANVLHHMLCKHNHVDGCGWDYGSWVKTPLESSRKDYLIKARKLIELYPETDLIEILLSTATLARTYFGLDKDEE